MRNWGNEQHQYYQLHNHTWIEGRNLLLSSPVEDQCRIVYGSSLQGCILSLALQVQTAGGQTLSAVDPPGEPRFIRRTSGKERKTATWGISSICESPKGDKLFWIVSLNRIFTTSWRAAEKRLFAGASRVRPRWQGPVCQGRGHHAGQLRPHRRIQLQPQPPAFWAALLPRFHIPGGMQEREQAQQEQCSRHLDRNKGWTQTSMTSHPDVYSCLCCLDRWKVEFLLRM